MSSELKGSRERVREFMSRCPTCFREAIHVPGPDFMFASVSCPFQISFTLKQFLKGWVLDFSRKGEAWQYPFDMAVLPRGCLCLRAVHKSTMWSLIDAPLEQDFHLLNPSLNVIYLVYRPLISQIWKLLSIHIYQLCLIPRESCFLEVCSAHMQQKEKKSFFLIKSHTTTSLLSQ